MRKLEDGSRTNSNDARAHRGAEKHRYTDIEMRASDGGARGAGLRPGCVLATRGSWQPVSLPQPLQLAMVPRALQHG